MEKVVIEVDVMLMSSTSMFLPGKYSPVVVGVCDQGDKDTPFSFIPLPPPPQSLRTPPISAMRCVYLSIS